MKKIKFPTLPSTYHDEHLRTVLNDTKQADDDNDNLQKVTDDRAPHVAEEIEHLPLDSRHLVEKHRTRCNDRKPCLQATLH